ncbi:MAG: protease pro-enzyme activation domain-containing protein [Terriglobales bacterium]
MRRLSATSLPFTALSILILSTLICSTLSFAAQPDRITGPINSSQTVALAKSLPRRAQPQYDQGIIDPSRQFGYVTLVISPSASQQQALQQLLAQQQDPKSAKYHKWLTPQQYADRFGLSQNDLNKITAWLQSQGFQILSIGGGRNAVAFSGTAAQVQRAFGTEIHNYQVDGKLHFANSTPLMIPSTLNGIVTGVIGLHSFGPRPANQKRGFSGAGNSRRNYYDANYLFPNFLAPGDVATIYDINPLYNNAGTPINGTGQTLAIIGQTDIYMADITDFRSGFGLNPISGCTLNASGVVTACNTTYFKYVAVGTDPGTPFSCGDLSEADLDIEWSGAIAQNAQIIFVNSPIVYNNNTDCAYVSGGGVNAALIAAVDPSTGPVIAPVVSMSYGSCEAEAESLETYLVQGNVEGVTIMNSSGDQGAAGCDFNPPNNAVNPPFDPAVNGFAVSYPASSPEVTGVGGTGISLANDSYPTPSSYWNTPNPNPTNGGTAVSYIPELAWNDGPEFVQFCQSDPTTSFCTTGNNTPGWVALGASATAAQVQSDIWISGGGGGASNCFTETGGGVCEAGFPQPTWQQGLSVPSAPASVRYVPDVSLLASPDFPGYVFCTPQSELGGSSTTSTCATSIFDAVDTYSSIVGGTSAASPIFAGIVALLNQYLAGSPSPGLGNINPKLYALAANSPAAFHQVTSGNNLVYCQPGTPVGQPANILCPSPAGVLGYEASNADSKTGYNLVTGLGSVDADKLALAWADGRTVSTTSVVAAPSSVVLGQDVTLTATVSPSTVVGIVTFFTTVNSSSTQIGTAEVSGGVATVTPTLTASGSNLITASFPGDGSDSASTGTTTVEVSAPSFSLTTPTTPAPAPAGESTTSTFKVTPTGGAATFAAAVTFACNGLPDATVSCSFNPTQIAAGAGATTVTVTITTTGPNSSGGVINRRRRADNRSPWLPLTLPLAGIVMVGLAGRKVSKYSAIVGLCVSLVFLGLLVACGGSSSAPVAVSVTPATGTAYPSYASWPAGTVQTTQFTATVTNTSNTAVNWSVSPASAGSISSTGLYAAPAIALGLPSSATITATSQASATATGSAAETITPTTVPTAVVGTPYSITVKATEGPTSNTTAAIALTVQ